MQQEQEPVERKLVLYLTITLVLIAAAAVMLLSAPNGTGLQRCKGLWIQSVRYSCMQGVALSSGNFSICGLMPGSYADSCYVQAANKAMNGSICYKAQNLSQRYACAYPIAVAQANYQMCQGLGEPYGSNCNYGIALSTNDTAICGGIANQTLSSACTAVLYTRKAIATYNATYCANVPDTTNTTVVNQVYSHVSYNLTGISLTGGSFLSSFALQSSNSARSVCYAFVAAGSRNGSLCYNIANATAKEACVIQLTKKYNASGYSANQSSNYSQLSKACQQLGGQAQLCQDYALIPLAVATKNVSICAGLPQGIDVQCYAALAVSYKNVSYCSYIKNASESSACKNGV